MKVDKNPDKIQFIFNDISSYYDKMNNLISFGMHYFVKSSAIKMLDIQTDKQILDICCGTGDFTGIISKSVSGAKVTGLDFSYNMIEKAIQKFPSNTFIVGDCTDIPFKNEEFDYVTVGFGMRNVENRTKAIKEVNRVLKFGGKFLHLDFAGGKNNFAAKIFNFATLLLVKFLGKNAEHYKYLLNSKASYPAPDVILKEFENAGFKLISEKNFVFGVINAQVLEKI